MDVPNNITALEKIKGLDLTHLKGIGKKTAKCLKDVLNVIKIADLAKRQINEEELLKLKTLGIREYNLNNWISISKKITASEIDEGLEPRKISILGLGNAGKTTLLNVLQDNVKIDLLRNLPPTLGVERVKLTKMETDCILWDMGGQEQFREEYLQNAEKYFLNIDLLIYIIDIQDPDNFEASLTYLQQILDILNNLKENPEFLILLHKVDPDIKDNEEIKSSIKLLNKKINDLFRNLKFKYEIMTYSIYNYLGANKNIINEIRDFLKSPEEDKLQTKFLGDSLERILNMIINLSSSIEERFSNMENIIENLRDWVEYIKKTLPLKPIKTPITEKVSKKIEELSQAQGSKSDLREELKSVLRLRKSD